MTFKEAQPGAGEEASGEPDLLASAAKAGVNIRLRRLYAICYPYAICFCRIRFRTWSSRRGCPSPHIDLRRCVFFSALEGVLYFRQVLNPCSSLAYSPLTQEKSPF